MNETAARDALLVRAYETAPGIRQDVWSVADQEWASRTALAVEGLRADPDAFIARRATLAAERITGRDRNAARACQILRWHPWTGRALLALALAAGMASDVIGASQRISLLSGPVLGLLAWNLVVYLVLFARYITSPWQARSARRWTIPARLAWIMQGFGTARRTARMPAPLPAFASAWLAASQPLTGARVASLLHAAAALFGAGMLAGMYLRGLVLEYRAGWESTFLDAGIVNALLKVVLGPAAALTGMSLPDAGMLETLRMPANPGGPAASWIHLYALTVVTVVLAPRSVLALWHGWRAKRLARRFPLPAGDGYFAGLSRAASGRSAIVQVLPCGARPAPGTRDALAPVLSAMLGPRTLLELAAPVALDEADAFNAGSDPLPDLLILLMPLAATPEAETHGAFIDSLVSRVPASVPIVMLIDESAFRARFADTGKSGITRIEERREAWRRMLEAIDWTPVFADLSALDSDKVRDPLTDALQHALRRTSIVSGQ
jgi:hypothetical protein